MTKFQRRVDDIEAEARKNEYNAYVVDEITRIINPPPPPKILCRVVHDPHPAAVPIDPTYFDKRNRCFACGETPVTWLGEDPLLGHKLYCERHATEVRWEERLPNHIGFVRWQKIGPRPR